MNEIQKKTETPLLPRRRFLASAGRIGAVAVLGGLALFLILKRTRLQREGQCLDPAGRLGCRRCGAYASCTLPKAASAKRNAEKNHGQQQQ